MTRQPFDEFAKQLFESLLAAFGTVSADRNVPGEARKVDIYFQPRSQGLINIDELGLLARLSETVCLFEPFRNPPKYTDIRNCLLKLFLMQAELHRQAERILPDADLPRLWILASSVSNQLLTDFGAELQSEWSDGIYFFNPAFRTAIIAINELPTTEETLWLRLLGKGTTQEQAIAELLSLPESNPKRSLALDLLVRWRINIEITASIDEEERAFLMALSQAYLEWERLTEQRGRQQGIEQGQRMLVESILRSRFGSLDPDLTAIIPQVLSLPSEESAPLLLNLSREELLTRFAPPQT